MTSPKTRFDALYSRHLTELKLQGKAQRTIDGYSYAIRRLRDYLGRCPDDVTTEELKAYFVWLVDARSWSAVKVDRNGIAFFFRHVLNREWEWINIVKPPVEKRLPDYLTPPEITQLLLHTREPRYQVFWLVAYGTGMRLSEVLNLQVGDIDRHRMLIHVRQGKGRKDRFVMLPEPLYLLLRQWWGTHRHPQFIFPGRRINNQPAPVVMDKGTTQKAFAKAKVAAGITKHVSIHSLRHSHATHLIERGLSLTAVQQQLGHTCPKTTAMYVRMTEQCKADIQGQLNHLVNQQLPSMQALAAATEGETV